MLNTDSLRQFLKDVYAVDDKYLVPMDKGWYVPTYDSSDKVGTWIGYRILKIKPNIRAGYTGNTYEKSIKVTFRLSFVGTQAEELALQTLLFDDRIDVVKALEKSFTQMNYTSREILTYPIREGGLNDSLCWYTDFECQSFYGSKAIKYSDWNVPVTPEPTMWIKNPVHKQGDNVLQSGDLKIKC